MRTVSIFFFILYFSTGFAQEPHFRTFDVNTGLPSSEVYYCLQDSKGFMWFATDRGVCRYDGHEILVFDQSDGLADEVIFEIREDHTGKIWFLGLNGQLSYFVYDHADRATGKIKSYPYNEVVANYFNPTSFYSFGITTDNTVVIGSQQKGLILVTSDGKLAVRDTLPAPSHCLNANYLEGQFYLSGFISGQEPRAIKDRHLFVKAKDTFIDYPITRDYVLKFKSAQVSEHKYIFAHSTHLVLIDLESHSNLALANFDAYITDLKQIGDEYWVSTLNGGSRCYQFEDGEFVLKNHLFKGLTVSGVCRDRSGGYWFSTTTKGVKYCGSLSMVTYNSSFGLASDYIGELNFIDGNLAIGYEADEIGYQILFRDSLGAPIPCQKSNYTVSDTIWSITDCEVSFLQNYFGNRCDDYITPCAFGFGGTIDRSQHGILVGKQVTLTLLNSKWEPVWETNKAPNGITAAIIGQDSEHVWVGTKTGLFHLILDTTGNILRTKHIFKSPITGLVKTQGDSIVAVTKTGMLLLCTINDNAPQFWQIPVDFKITVNCLYQDHFGHLWVGTNKGVLELSSSGDQILKHYSIESGLPSNECTAILLSDEHIYIGTKNGLSVIPVNINDKGSGKSSPPFIKRVLLDQEQITTSKPIHITNKTKSLVIQFADFNFHAVSGQSYRYRIPNLMDEWSALAAGELTLTSFPEDGTYQVEIQSFEGIENWSESSFVSFTSLPPFYKTTWFKIILPLSFILLILLFFKYNILSYNKHIVREILARLMRRLGKTEYIILNSDRSTIRIPAHEVLFIQSSREYVEIHTEKSRFVHRSTMKDLLKIVGQQNFIQVHRSYIVRKDKIDIISAKSLKVGSVEIPIGRTYRDELKALKSQFNAYGK